MVRLDFTPTKARSQHPLEADEQKACWEWLGLKKFLGVCLQDYCYHVANGAQLAGSRSRRAAAMNSLKSQGFRPGVSDIVIAYPIWGTVAGHCLYTGAYIELKREPGAYKGPAAKRAAVRPEQIEWLERMQSVGYWVSISYGFEDFRHQVESYLRGEAPRALDFIPE